MIEDRFLQALNGAAMLPALACLVLLARYLSRESRRRGLRSMDWFHLPPSMNLALAVLVFDVGVCLRVLAAWIWFLTGQRLAQLQTLFLISVLLTITGFLCKIRALTEPDHGKLPWIVLSTVTAAATILLFIF